MPWWHQTTCTYWIISDPKGPNGLEVDRKGTCSDVNKRWLNKKKEKKEN